MSIFSGLTPDSLRIAVEAAKRSPQGLAALAVAGAVAVLALGVCAAFAARHIAAFNARVQEEDELAAREEREGGETDGEDSDGDLKGSDGRS